MRLVPLTAAAVVGLAFAPLASAQPGPRQGPPEIVASGHGEVRVTPDRVVLSVGVQTRASSAAQAASENARKQARVIAALKAQGVAAQQVSTSGFSVNPETQYDRSGQQAPRTSSYLVSNTVTVETGRVEAAGALIDAALGAGANDIRGLSFSVANADSARRAALALAVDRARGDAEVAARAAGGALGRLIELTVGEAPTGIPRPVFAARMAAEATPIEAGLESVQATVSTRWEFVARPDR